MIITMIGITILLLILSTFTMVGSAYYSDKNYKLGKLLWRTSIISGFVYSISGLTTLGIAIYKLLDFLF